MSNELAKREETKFNDLLSFINAQTDEADTAPACKLCNSARRKDAEAMSDRNQSNRAIHQWLESQGEDISYNAVNNHFNNHFKGKQEKQSLREFSNKMARWTQVAKTDAVLFERYINFLDMEAMTLASENSNLSLPERRKNDEMILKIAQTISLYKEQSHKVQAELRPIEVMIKSLNKIIQIKIESSNNPDVRKILTEIIEHVVKEAGDLQLDEKDTQ